jgi:hypothetical protein
MIFFWGLCFLILLSVWVFLHIIIAGIHVNRDKMLPSCTKQNTNEGYGNTEIQKLFYFSSQTASIAVEDISSRLIDKVYIKLCWFM